jgi:endonuclease/exonuclease/phosphatase family metal-dependent hydrolase
MIIFTVGSGKLIMMKKSITFSIAVIIIAVAINSCRSNKDTVKVMTINIRYDNPADSNNAWPNRASQVCNFINGEKPDILGMQEVLLSQYENLDSILTGYSSVGVGRDDGAKKGEMNPVFYRKDKYDMVRTITFWLSDSLNVPGSKGWGASLPRIVTWMELVDKTSHDHFFFFNTHFAHDSDSARVKSSRILMDQVVKIAGASPFIISGDFNMLPSSRGYAILTGPDESVPVLEDAYIISEERPTGPTYTFNGFSDKPGDGRIDYIFVKSGMKVYDHKTIISKDKGIFISDHWPVEATILLK